MSRFLEILSSSDSEIPSYDIWFDN